MSGKVVGFLFKYTYRMGILGVLRQNDISGDLFEKLTRAKNFQIELAVKSSDCLCKYNYNPPLCSRRGLRPRPR